MYHWTRWVQQVVLISGDRNSTIYNPIGCLNLVPPLHIYQDYFTRLEMDPFIASYASILCPYHVDPENATTNTIPQEAAQNTYSAYQNGVPIALLQCNLGNRRSTTQVTLLHSASHYVPQIGMPESHRTNIPLSWREMWPVALSGAQTGPQKSSTRSEIRSTP